MKTNDPQILKPLQRVQVTESTKVCKPGSTGYLVCQESNGGYNIWERATVFTRFGKKGKLRIAIFITNTPIIYYDVFKDADRKVLETVEQYEGLKPTLHPSDINRAKPMFSIVEDDVKLKPLEMGHKNLLDISNWEFLGYIKACSLFIHKLLYNKRVYALIKPPLPMQDMVLRGAALDEVHTNVIGYFILEGLKSDASNKDKRCEERYIQAVSDQTFRLRIINALVKDIAMIKDLVHKYTFDAADAYLTMVARHKDVLNYYKKHKAEVKMIKETGRTTPVLSARPDSPKLQKHSKAKKARPWSPVSKDRR